MIHPHRSSSSVSTRRRFLGTVAGLGIGAALRRGLQSRAAARFDAESPITVLGPRPDWAPGMNLVFDAFRDKFGVGVDFEPAAFSDLQAEQEAGFASGNPHDVVAFLEGRQIRDAAANKLILDLTGAVSIDQIILPARDQLVFDGGLWGVPLASYTWGIFYWKPAFAAVGASDPKSWDDLFVACQLLLDAKQTPILMPAAEGAVPYFAYILAVSSLLGVDGWPELLQGNRRLDDGDLVGAAQLLVDLVPYFNPDFAKLDFPTARLQFIKGLGAMTVGSSLDYTRLSNPAQVGGNSDLGFLPFPSPDGTRPPATVTGVDALYTATAARNRKEAIDLLAWLVQPEAQQIVADNLALPVNATTTPSTDPLSAMVVAVRQGATDLPVWYAIPATADTFAGAQSLLGPLLEGGLNATDFAAKLQESIAAPQPNA